MKRFGWLLLTITIILSIIGGSCQRFQALEQLENGRSVNVAIHKNIPDTNRKPNVHIVLAKHGLNNNSYKYLKDMQKLFAVRNNESITIPAGLFSHLSIEELNLQHNRIIDIQVGAFNDVVTFKRLFITNNGLTEVKSGVFNNLPLETLSLSNNRISLIERNSFMNMPRLRSLHLDGNQLSEFQPETLMNNPKSLDELYLQNNIITAIDRSTVAGLDNLRILHLQNNKIQHLPTYTFDNLLNLEALLLANNLINELNAEAFPKNGLQKLQKLSINNNRLSYLTIAVLERFRNLKLISTVGNPWQCPCYEAILVWLHDHDVQQKCNTDYEEGTRPVCIVDENHANICEYNNKDSYYQKYSEANDKAAANMPCEL